MQPCPKVEVYHAAFTVMIYGFHGYEYGISQRAFGLGLHARTVSHMPPLGGESQCLCSRSRSSSVQPNSSPRENSGAL